MTQAVLSITALQVSSDGDIIVPSSEELIMTDDFSWYDEIVVVSYSLQDKYLMSA